MHATLINQLLTSSPTLICVDLSVVVDVEHTSGMSLPLSPMHTNLVTRAHLLGGSPYWSVEEVIVGVTSQSEVR